MNGILAYAVSFINSNKIESWRILFLLEGGLTLLLAVIAVFILPEGLPTCKWLTQSEKDYCEGIRRRPVANLKWSINMPWIMRRKLGRSTGSTSVVFSTGGNNYFVSCGWFGGFVFTDEQRSS